MRILRRCLPLLVMTAVLVGAVPAWAHVEVQADKTKAGARNATLTFHVPNELAPAATVGIQIVLPTDHPLIGVTARTGQHGFASNVISKRVGDSNVASEVDFTGGRITGTAELPFTVSVRQMPSDVKTLTFRALQTYSSGVTVSWIEIAADGAPEPEHPAPVLTLAPAAPAGAAPVRAPSSADHGVPVLLLAVIAFVGLLAMVIGGGWIHRRSHSSTREPELDEARR